MSPTRPVIGICSLKGDLHALWIERTLRETFGVGCHVFETDNTVHAGGLSWTPDDGRVVPPLLRDRTGAWVDVSALDVLWWRRSGFGQLAHEAVTTEDDRALVDNEWKYALIGALFTQFGGQWVSHPEASRRAENKLVQLQTAVACGLTIPRTLVSSEAAAIRQFGSTCGDRGVIVKAVRGARRRFLWASRVDLAAIDDAGLSLCPAIYQEYVAGDEHLRICCFGERVVCFATRTADVDSRGDIGAPMREVALDTVFRAKILAYLRVLGLRMAIMDAKVTPSGDIVWMEANPQGQFLYAQGITGVDLTTPFTEFLLEEAGRPPARALGSSAAA